MLSSGLLTECFGPETITVAALGFAGEFDPLGRGNFFFDATEIGAEFFVVDNAEPPVLEVLVKTISKTLLIGGRELAGVNFPGKKLMSALG